MRTVVDLVSKLFEFLVILASHSAYTSNEQPGNYNLTDAWFSHLIRGEIIKTKYMLNYSTSQNLHINSILFVNQLLKMWLDTLILFQSLSNKQ